MKNSLCLSPTPNMINELQEKIARQSTKANHAKKEETDPYLAMLMEVHNATLKHELDNCPFWPIQTEQGTYFFLV